jgi:hypothetical protein
MGTGSSTATASPLLCEGTFKDCTTRLCDLTETHLVPGTHPYYLAVAKALVEVHRAQTRDILNKLKNPLSGYEGITGRFYSTAQARLDAGYERAVNWHVSGVRVEVGDIPRGSGYFDYPEMRRMMIADIIETLSRRAMSSGLGLELDFDTKGGPGGPETVTIYVRPRRQDADAPPATGAPPYTVTPMPALSAP